MSWKRKLEYEIYWTPYVISTKASRHHIKAENASPSSGQQMSVTESNYLRHTVNAVASYIAQETLFVKWWCWRSYGAINSRRFLVVVWLESVVTQIGNISNHIPLKPFIFMIATMIFTKLWENAAVCQHETQNFT